MSDTSNSHNGFGKPPAEIRHDLVGDGYDSEPLLIVREVAEILRIPTKSVYDLPIPRVVIGKRRVRYRPRDVREFIDRRLQML